MAARRDRLARARKAAGYTQESLAEALHLDRTTVARWEAGKWQPLPYLRPKLARLLAITNEAMAELLDEAEAPTTIPAPLAEEVDALLRRDFLKHGLAAAVERSHGSRAANAADVEELHAMQDSFIALDDQHGGGAVLPMATAYLNSEVTPLLHGRYPESVKRRLFTAAAELTLITGFMSYDAAQHWRARQHYTEVLRLSREVGDHALSARVLTAMSHQASYLEDRDDAIAFARLAHQGATACAPAVQVICAVTEARALAASGQQQACFALMRETERAFARVDADEAPAWLRFVDEAELTGKFGRCLRDLGLHTEAARQLEASLNLHTDSYPRSRAITQIIYATNCARQGELEAACHLGTAAIPAVGRLRSQRTREYLRDLEQHLSPYAQEPLVQEFRQQSRPLLAAGNG